MHAIMNSNPLRGRLLAALGALLLFLAAPAPLAASGPGHLVLNGGGGKPPAVMEKFIELAGGRDATIVVFPTASGEPDTGAFYGRLFRREYGCTDVRVAAVHNPREARMPRFVAMVDAADGIFFSGGDQRRIITALRDSPVGEAVQRAHRRGAVVGGTSAGTACQSPLMITGDGDFSRIEADNVELWPGLGLFPGVIVDQHFVARGRHNRLLSVVLEHPQLLGVGVDEDTAVWVRPDGSFQVLGAGWVVVYDARSAVIRRGFPGSDVALGASGLLTHVLLPGQVFDLATGQVVEAAR
jgi:cyanophycinase